MDGVEEVREALQGLKPVSSKDGSGIGVGDNWGDRTSRNGSAYREEAGGSERITGGAMVRRKASGLVIWW